MNILPLYSIFLQINTPVGTHSILSDCVLDRVSDYAFIPSIKFLQKLQCNNEFRTIVIRDILASQYMLYGFS